MHLLSTRFRSQVIVPRVSLCAMLLVAACDQGTATMTSAIVVQDIADASSLPPVADVDIGTGGGLALATGGVASTTPFDADASVQACALAPSIWTCDPCRFEDAVCDCDCGADDPVCQAGQCKVVPAMWACEQDKYMDGLCDCECGAWDPDCDVDAITDDCVAGVCVQPGHCELTCTAAAPDLPLPGQYAAPDYSIDPNSAIVFFHNDGGLIINDLRVRLSNSSAWGVNQLDTETINPQNFYAMRGIPCDTSLDIQTRSLLSSGATSSPTEQLGVQFVCDKRQVLLLP